MWKTERILPVKLTKKSWDELSKEIRAREFISLQGAKLQKVSKHDATCNCDKKEKSFAVSTFHCTCPFDLGTLFSFEHSQREFNESKLSEIFWDEVKYCCNGWVW